MRFFIATFRPYQAPRNLIPRAVASSVSRLTIVMRRCAHVVHVDYGMQVACLGGGCLWLRDQASVFGCEVAYWMNGNTDPGPLRHRDGLPIWL